MLHNCNVLIEKIQVLQAIEIDNDFNISEAIMSQLTLFVQINLLSQVQ